MEVSVRRGSGSPARVPFDSTKGGGTLRSRPTTSRVIGMEGCEDKFGHEHYSFKIIVTLDLAHGNKTPVGSLS